MEFNKHKAIYMQIADYICDNILNEEWQKGDKILSVRELAGNIGVNPNTVMSTYKYLTDQGIIFNKRGIGYHVTDDAVAKTRKLKKNEFVSNYLPELFRAMDVLGIDFDELKGMYEKQNHNGHASI